MNAASSTDAIRANTKQYGLDKVKRNFSRCRPLSTGRWSLPSRHGHTVPARLMHGGAL